jgi:hypothetical protein
MAGGQARLTSNEEGGRKNEEVAAAAALDIFLIPRRYFCFA